jgi:hypothetical protein
MNEHSVEGTLCDLLTLHFATLPLTGFLCIYLFIYFDNCKHSNVHTNIRTLRHTNVQRIIHVHLCQKMMRMSILHLLHTQTTAVYERTHHEHI